MQYVETFYIDLIGFRKEYLNDISENSLIFNNKSESIDFNVEIKKHYKILDDSVKNVLKIKITDKINFDDLNIVFKFINDLNNTFSFIKNLERFNEFNIKIGTSLYGDIMKEYKNISHKYHQFNEKIDEFTQTIIDQFNNELKDSSDLLKIPKNKNFIKFVCGIEIKDEIVSNEILYVYNNVIRSIKYDALSQNSTESNSESSTFLYNYFLSPFAYTKKELVRFFADINIKLPEDDIPGWCKKISKNNKIKIYFVDDRFNKKKLIYYDVEKIRTNNQIQHSGITDHLIDVFRSIIVTDSNSFHEKSLEASDKNKLESESINDILQLDDSDGEFIIISYIGNDNYRILINNNHVRHFNELIKPQKNIFVHNNYIKNEFINPDYNMKTKSYDEIFIKNSNIKEYSFIPDKFENEYAEFILKYDTIKMDTVKLKLNRIMQDLSYKTYKDIDSMQRIVNFIGSDEILEQFDKALNELYDSISDTIKIITKGYTEQKINFIKNEVFISFISEKLYYTKKFKNNLEETFNDLKNYFRDFKDSSAVLQFINSIFQKTIDEVITRKSNIYEKLLTKLFIMIFTK